MNTVSKLPLRNAYERGYFQSWTRDFYFNIHPSDELNVSKRFPIKKNSNEVWDDLFKKNDVDFVLKHDYNGNAISKMFFHLFPAERTGTLAVKSQPDLGWSATCKYQRDALERFTV